jgi:translation initiation factor IF-2
MAAKGGQNAGDDNDRVASSSDLLRLINQTRETKLLPVIIKADVQGSLKSVLDSLRGLNTDDVNVQVVSSGVGPISENDVVMASTSGAVVYGFNVDMPVGVKQVALRDKLTVHLYRVIYELIDDAKQRMSDLLEDEIVVEEVGRLIVKGVFRTTQKLVICGGEVTKGVVKPDVLAKVMRDDKEVAEVKIVNVKTGDIDANEVPKGEMCGLSLETEEKIIIKEGDKLELFTRESKERSL